MTDQDRFENAEDVRNLYREQGAERERERIMKTLEGFPIEIYRNGMLEEQQRIIRLLEKQDSVSAGWSITLIKGKSQKDNETVVLLTEEKQMNDYPHDPEQEAIDIRRTIVRQQQASFENLIKLEERQRIIKLLEEIQDTTNNAKIYCDVLIDLIKGVRDEA